MMSFLDRIADGSVENVCCLITFGLYMTILTTLEESARNIQNVMPKVLKSISPDIQLPAKISNLTCSVKKAIEKSKKCENKNEILTQAIPSLYRGETKIAGYSAKDLLAGNVKENSSVTVGFILELRRFLRQFNLPWKLAITWLCKICSISPPDIPKEGSVCNQWAKLYVKRANIVDKEKIINFENQPYHVPKTLQLSDPLPNTSKLKCHSVISSQHLPKKRKNIQSAPQNKKKQKNYPEIQRNHQFAQNQVLAVAYDTDWFVGEVLSVKNNLASVQIYLHAKESGLSSGQQLMTSRTWMPNLSSLVALT